MPMEIEKVKALLQREFAADEIEVLDTMDNGDYYNITVTSSLFVGVSKVKQHQMVYNALGSVVGNEIHSVTVNTKVKDS